MAEHDSTYAPPPGPPPILTADDIRHIAFQGWLPLSLPESLLRSIGDLFGAAGSLFDLHQDEKRKLYPASRGTENGLYLVKNEKEYLTLRHRIHADSTLEQHASEVWRASGLLLRRILCDLSRAGGNPIDPWTNILDGSINLPDDSSRLDDVISLMRLFRYYPTSGVAAAPHADLGLLTLCVGKGRGLQVLDRSIEPPDFIDVEGPVVLIGSTLQILMRNRVRSGVHRVVGNPQGRSSMVFALRPCLKYPIDLTEFGGTGIVNSADFYNEIKESKYSINATKKLREEQQKAQQAQRDEKTGENNAEFGQG